MPADVGILQRLPSLGIKRRSAPTPRRRAEAQLLAAIRAAHDKGCGNYGPRKIAKELRALGIQAGLNRIKRLRRQHGIVCNRARNWKATTNSKHQ